MQVCVLVALYYMKKLCDQYMYYITVLEATRRTASVTGELQSQVPVT